MRDRTAPCTFHHEATVAWYAPDSIVAAHSRRPPEDRQLRVAEARELVDMLTGVGRHDQVAAVRLERFLRARGFGEEADRVA